MPDHVKRRLKEAGLEPKVMNIWLLKTQEIIQYHCLFCAFDRNLWRTQQRAVMAMFGEGSDLPFLTVPITIQCPKCGAIYHLQGFNE